MFVSDDERDAVLSTLDDADVDYVVVGASSERGGSLVEFPLPTDAVGDVFDELHDAGLPDDAYTVVGSAETASTETLDLLQDRYANNFSPITAASLRSKARDMANDWRSYVWLVLLSALIATGGLVADSPAIVVGSMVIAPLVGPVLTAGVGAVTGDGEMLFDSVRFQVAGLVVAVGGATAFGFLLGAFGFVPSGLGVTALELVSLRVAPSIVAVTVALAAGSAAAFSLTTEGPTSLVGVMVAAALVPAAATTGIAFVWGTPALAVGSFLLLSVTVVGINVGVWVTLRYLGYQSEGSVVGRLRKCTKLVVAGVVLLAVVGAVFAGTYGQLSYERDATAAVEEVVDDRQYAELDVVSVRPSYSSPFLSSPRTVTVVVQRPSGRTSPDLPRRLRRQLASSTGRQVTVRVQYVEYAISRPGNQPSNGSSRS